MPNHRPFTIALTLFATVCWIVPPAVFAERIGEAYRGPRELLSGGSGAGTDTGSSGGSTGNSGGSSGGSSGGGSSGGSGGNSGGSSGGSSGGVGGGAGGGAGGTGRGAVVSIDGSRLWQWWWEYNKDRFLAQATKKGRIQMGSAYYWFGSGAKYPPREIVHVAESQKESLFESLKTMALGDSDMRVRTEACTALGRLGVIPVAPDLRKKGESDNAVVRTLTQILDHEQGVTPAAKDLRVSAILALGMTGDGDACAYLLRQYTGNAKATPEEQAAMGIALGLARCKDAIPALAEKVPNSGRQAATPAELGAMMGLGLLGPEAAPEVEKDKALQKLTHIADEYRGDTPTVMQAVAALGRMQIELRTLLKAFNRTKTNDIEWTIILAMPNYSKEPDAEHAAKFLMTKAYERGAGQRKSFAVLAAGDLASRLDPNSRTRELLLKFLRKVLSGHDNYLRSNAALALGIAGDHTVVPAIAQLLQDPTSTNYVVGASCVSLGLLHATDQTEKIENEVLLKPRWDADARGYAALGIALMGDTTRIGELTQFQSRRDLNQKTLRQTPLALGILGDAGTVGALVQIFSHSWKQNDKFEISTAASALSWLRDQSAVDDLLKLAKSQDAEVRGMAAIAMGHLATHDTIDPLSRTYADISHLRRFGGWDLLYKIGFIA